jgi:hypothetical protein
MTLADQIRALKRAPDAYDADERWNATLDRAAELADAQAGQLSNDERLEYQMALIWCSAAAEFAPEGQAREGWLKLCKPLIDRQPIEGASRDNWCAWLDDLPLPDGFSEGIASLQEFIHGLPQAGLVAAAYEAAADACADYPRVAPDATEARHYDEQIDHSQACIRAMTPADALAALDRIKAEARREGMREAAGIMDAVRFSTNLRSEMSLLLRVRDAILRAALEQIAKDE